MTLSSSKESDPRQPKNDSKIDALYPWIKTLQFFAVVFVVGVVGGNFGPKSGGMIHMVQMGELVENDIVAEDFGDLHEADIERNRAVRGTTTPTRGGVGETAFVVLVAVEFGEVFEAIGEVVARLFHEEFFLGVAGALGARVAERDFFANQVAVNFQKPFDQKVAGAGGHRHLKSTRRRDGEAHAARHWIFANNDFAKLVVLQNHCLELGQNLFELGAVSVLAREDNGSFGFGRGFEGVDTRIVDRASLFDGFQAGL